ncbi:hypothetical protein L2719_12130 [Shewanella schlegeliana]|uniref:PilZ domain-containing protein n=1 Tax=Shewanella schlegeliana TaxID=190308 RepID=A0ABS1ST85_9GAMM|nr:hypothetical protein [Shewanella schlegeliana]MBL4911752.1 hypothetical protein [Shewanella schlegeliana]MCL1110296.1 hypothetical protein [Shewanella schlegeliana]GIU31536.1 hypothetical protein TUM4433_23360 [Shewanella schlegeliana]
MLTDSTAYFSINHPFDVYLSPWDSAKPLPLVEQLGLMLPTSLQLISDVKALESDCLLQLRHLDDDAKTVVEFLKLQSRKIDMVLQHIMAKEEYEGTHYIGKQFGGSGITLVSPTPLELGQVFQVTLHIKEELVALLCFAKVTSCSLLEATDAQSTTQYAVELSFCVIQDNDVEQLVKASLTLQQKQLKLRQLSR